jgi:type IV fimbrial biogenesis protein FimT
LAELLTAVAIIGVMAAAASPVFVRQLRDGRVQSAATNFADVVRTARSRAQGRGSAVLVRWSNGAALPTATNQSAHLVMREAVQGTNAVNAGCAPTPATSCLTTNWANNSTTSQYVGGFDERTPQYLPSQAAFADPDGNVVAYAEICFSPRGRSFIRYADNDAFVPLTGVPRIQVTNSESTFVRQVVIPPNGAARVVSRL